MLKDSMLQKVHHIKVRNY